MRRLHRGFICSECISAAAQPVSIPPPGRPQRRCWRSRGVALPRAWDRWSCRFATSMGAPCLPVRGPPAVAPRWLVVRSLSSPLDLSGGVPVIEVKEILPVLLDGPSLREVPTPAGVDRKTVRRYVAAGKAAELVRDGGLAHLDDALLGAVPGGS